MRTIKVLMQARWIPDGGIVSKRNGEKQYTIRTELKLYDYPIEKHTETIGKPGIKFLLSDTGNINAVPDNTDLIWHTDLQALSLLLGALGE